MYLTYNTISIRNARPDDAELLAEWWNDGKIMAHAGFPNGLGTTAETVRKEIGPGCLILLWDITPIGEMCYRSTEAHTAEIGIKICRPEYQDKGIGKIALSMLIKELFQLGYSKIVLDTNLNNVRAQHVYETLGFQKLRIHQDSWQDQLGQWQSSVDYALTAKTFINFAV